jgi:hypothetical protein
MHHVFRKIENEGLYIPALNTFYEADCGTIFPFLAELHVQT